MSRTLCSAVLSFTVALTAVLTGCDSKSAGTPPAESTDTRVYECPMQCVKPGETHPYTHVGPGDCPVCGMHLAPRPEEPAPTTPTPTAAPTNQ